MIATASGAIATDRPALAAGLPDVTVPVPSVEVPSPPTLPKLPSLPAPVSPQPAPAPVPVPVPVPAVPAPVPVVGQPGGPSGGSGAVRPLPTGQVERLVSAATPQQGNGGTSELWAGQGGSGGTEAGRRKRARRGSSRVQTLPYERRLRVVRALRGCLDRLPERQSNALILRYGVGTLRRQRSRDAADAINVSLERFRVIHRRGLRNLVVEARLTGCEHGGVADETIASAVDVAWADAVTDRVSTVLAARGGGDRPRSEVLGVSESGGEDALDDLGGGSGSAGGRPEAASLFGGLPLDTNSPLLLALLAIMLAGATWIIMSFVRASR